jgi:pilus assembly protein Flp/PilA
MRRFTQAVASFLHDEGGPTGVEYAIMMALIIIACVASIGVVGKKTKRDIAKVHVKRHRGHSS